MGGGFLAFILFYSVGYDVVRAMLGDHISFWNWPRQLGEHLSDGGK